MADIITLTINPAIDTSTAVGRVTPDHKLRCGPTRRDPGGGGINVARVARRFGADVVALYPTGGVLGQLLRRLTDREDIRSLSIPIAEETREDFTVSETETGQQYRFVLPGPRLSEAEWRACLDAFVSFEGQPHFVVASGSLPPGVPEDFYGRIAKAANQAGTKMVVDSSGAALKAVAKAGVYLLKPSLRELTEMVDRALGNESDWVAASRKLVTDGCAEVVALTLGDKGALLVTSDQALRAPAIPIKPVSTVGAGDSFLGAMIWSLCSGHGLQDAFRYGVAAGSAALLTPGTDLCRREDVERLLGDVKIRAI